MIDVQGKLEIYYLEQIIAFYWLHFIRSFNATFPALLINFYNFILSFKTFNHINFMYFDVNLKFRNSLNFQNYV